MPGVPVVAAPQWRQACAWGMAATVAGDNGPRSRAAPGRLTAAGRAVETSPARRLRWLSVKLRCTLGRAAASRSSACIGVRADTFPDLAERLVGWRCGPSRGE